MTLGANVNADSVRQTPLHLCAKLAQGGVALAAFLLSKGGTLSLPSLLLLCYFI